MKIKKFEFERRNDFSMLLQDGDICFWVDCYFIDGYGNKTTYTSDDVFIDWDFNQYIFYIENENDVMIMKYQENQDNRDKIQDFIDEQNDELIELFRKAKERGRDYE